MISKDRIVASMCRASADVFSTMLGVEIGEGAVSTETSTPEGTDGVMSFIGVAGSWVGTGCVACSPVLACRICSQLLLTEACAVNEEVLDAVAELTNMIIGGVKTDLEDVVGPLGLSLPTVVFGKNFKTRSAGNPEWIVIRYHLDEEPLVVRFCLARNERHGIQAPPRHACSLEI